MKIHVRHILTEQRYEAEDVLKKLQQGEAFEDLARKFSKCPSAARGGDLGEVDSSRFVEPFAEAAEGLTFGEVSPVVGTRFGYHLIKRLS
jgi:parvulin-like peptidyl-prolyl isomerase